jgi:hypothetical protein
VIDIFGDLDMRPNIQSDSKGVCLTRVFTKKSVIRQEQRVEEDRSAPLHMASLAKYSMVGSKSVVKRVSSVSYPSNLFQIKTDVDHDTVAILSQRVMWVDEVHPDVLPTTDKDIMNYRQDIHTVERGWPQKYMFQTIETLPSGYNRKYNLYVVCNHCRIIITIKMNELNRNGCKTCGIIQFVNHTTSIGSAAAASEPGPAAAASEPASASEPDIDPGSAAAASEPDINPASAAAASEPDINPGPAASAAAASEPGLKDVKGVESGSGLECVRVVRSVVQLQRYSKSREDFVKKSKAMYGDVYDYSMMRFTTSNEPAVDIMCTRHRDVDGNPVKFTIPTAKNHTGRGTRSRCSRCMMEKYPPLEAVQIRVSYRSIKFIELAQYLENDPVVEDIPEGVESKICQKCNLTKRLSDFQLTRRTDIGVACRYCRNLDEKYRQIEDDTKYDEEQHRYCSGCCTYQPLAGFHRQLKQCFMCIIHDRTKEYTPAQRAERNRLQREKKYYLQYRQKQIRNIGVDTYRQYCTQLHIAWMNTGTNRQRVNAQKKLYTVLKYNSLVFFCNKIGRQCTLTYEQACIMYYQPCIYCGQQYTTRLTGIDRLNSSIGYIMENTVSCCYDCNMMKHCLDPITFIYRCRHLTDHEYHPEAWQHMDQTNRYSGYKYSAAKKNLPFELSEDDYESIINQPCYYCKLSIHPTRGIDRINNKQGYLIENCVPACAECNYMKSTYHIDIFMDHIRKVAQFSSDLTQFSHIPRQYKSIIHTRSVYQDASPSITTAAAVAAAAASADTSHVRDESISDLQSDMCELNALQLDHVESFAEESVMHEINSTFNEEYQYLKSTIDDSDQMEEIDAFSIIGMDQLIQAIS